MGSEIFIISESFDKSAQNIMEWLYFYGEKNTRKNVDTDFEKFYIKISNNSLQSSLTNKFILNRRGYIPLMPQELKKTIWGDYLKREQLPVLFYLENLNKSNYIGSYNQEFSNNKILNLRLAADSGLKIPNTIVTNNKENLLQFIEKGKKYITKSIYISPYIETTKESYYGNGTIELDTNNISENFAPSLVQEYIEKEIEIRVFFIQDTFYSMAIFSQKNIKTKIDFKNYDKENPNRNVPFLLPDEILTSIKRFIKKTDSNTGSIDLILRPTGDYVFLEINPMGQYDWLSENCNYYIDKKIAEILINESKYE
jgi:hypothetical protein